MRTLPWSSWNSHNQPVLSVFAIRDFSKGEFLLEYAGELLRFAEGRKRIKDYPLILGTPKSKQNNSVMKILEVDGVPQLVLYASRKIGKGEEIRYDYGEKNLPWRKKETKIDEIPGHFPLRCPDRHIV
nr:N-lysine methyltransferase KMT5A-like [Crassostrea gigas]